MNPVTRVASKISLNTQMEKKSQKVITPSEPKRYSVLANPTFLVWSVFDSDMMNTFNILP